MKGCLLFEIKDMHKKIKKENKCNFKKWLQTFFHFENKNSGKIFKPKAQKLNY